SVADFSPHASFAACAASNASSTSSGVECATSVIGRPVAGHRSARYLPCVGASHLPPMKFSYRGATVTMLSAWPGGAYFISVLLKIIFRVLQRRKTRLGFGFIIRSRLRG